MPSEAEPRSPSRANADDASADVAEGAMARRRASLDGKVLVGGEGQDYIAATLSRADDVAAAMERVRKHGALLDADTEPALGLLSALGVKRGEAYREMLERAVAELTRRAPTLPQGTLLSLLDASFPYIGIEELKAVPLTVFAHMTPVPSSYLKQVSRDMGMFRQLPVEVQRQCWVKDAALLRRHVSPSMMAYGEETEAVRMNMNQDMTLAELNASDDWSPTSAARGTSDGGAGGAKSRKALRTESASVNRLRNIIGTTKNSMNPSLYIEVIRLCRAHFANSGDDSACSLRSQLLMSYHDAGENELCSMDKCHRLAWLMDACIRDRYLDGRRLKEMGSLIDNAVKKAKSKTVKKPTKTKPTRFRIVGFGAKKAEAKKDGNESDDGGSISRVHDVHERDDTLEQVPGDMGMILQDPPVLHLLLHETIRTLEAVIEAEGVPKKEPRLHDLTKFICLALTSQACLRENFSEVPATPEPIVKDFYTLLGKLMLDVMLRDNDDDMETDGAHEPDIDVETRGKFKELMIWSPAIRKIMLTYALICLQRNNIRTATEVLEIAADVLIDDVIIYEGAFALTLANRMSTMLKKKQTTVDSALWKYAVDGILIRSTSASLEVHEEVLRMLMLAADELTTEALATAVEATLINTKKSRKQRKKRAKQIVYEYEPIDTSKHARHGSSHNFGATADVHGIAASSTSAASVDSIRAACELFASTKKLSKESAPILFDWLNKRSKCANDGDNAGIAGTGGYFDDEGDEGGSILDFGLSRDVKSPSVVRDSPLMSPRRA